MPDINYQNIGIAGVQTDSFTQTELFFGDTPPVVTEDAIVPEAIATAGLPAWTPVYVDPETRVLALVDLVADPAVTPNAITVFGIAAGTPADSGLSVYKAGHVNIHAVNWPAAYDTEAKKRGAFVAAGGNQLYVGVPVYNQS